MPFIRFVLLLTFPVAVMAFQTESVDRVRQPIFHAHKAGRTFVKTLLKNEAGQTLYYFESCATSYENVKSAKDFEQITIAVNSIDTKCHAINTTVFDDGDQETKMALTRALTTALERELDRAQQKSQDKQSTFNVGAAQTISTLGSTLMFAGPWFVDKYSKNPKFGFLKNPAANWFAHNGAFIVGYLAFMATLNGVNSLQAYMHRNDPDAIEIDPKLVVNDPTLHLNVDLPPRLSNKSAEEALERSIDKATDAVYHELRLQQRNPPPLGAVQIKSH